MQRALAARLDGRAGKANVQQARGGGGQRLCRLERGHGLAAQLRGQRLRREREGVERDGRAQRHGRAQLALARRVAGRRVERVDLGAAQQVDADRVCMRDRVVAGRLRRGDADQAQRVVGIAVAELPGDALELWIGRPHQVHRELVVRDVHRGRARLAAGRDDVAGVGDVVLPPGTGDEQRDEALVRLAGGRHQDGQVVGVVHLQVAAAVADRMQAWKALGQGADGRGRQAAVRGLLDGMNHGRGRRRMRRAAAGEQRGQECGRKETADE